mmetsp:Transcript_93/g.170  ORF Transcript_93/g.170 Transcript_93/m.170 type:complete len:171 (-) Transcript_93:370-882(-)
MSGVRAGSFAYTGGHRLCVIGSGLRKTDLQGAFNEFGHIVQIETPKPGLAFVVFKEKGDAREALEEMDAGTVNGTKVTVTWAEVRPPASSRGRDWHKETPRSEQGAGGSQRETLTTTTFERDMGRASRQMERKKQSRSPSRKRQRESSRSTSRQRGRSRGDRRRTRSRSR